MARPMSALGHKRTFCDARAMSALSPKADIRRGNLLGGTRLLHGADRSGLALLALLAGATRVATIFANTQDGGVRLHL